MNMFVMWQHYNQLTYGKMLVWLEQWSSDSLQQWNMSNDHCVHPSDGCVTKIPPPSRDGVAKHQSQIPPTLRYR